MELKRREREIKNQVEMLLIVPYGIETNAPCAALSARRLLIVPYGIETRA